jgi:hypothetical protein
MKPISTFFAVLPMCLALSACQDRVAPPPQTPNEITSDAMKTTSAVPTARQPMSSPIEAPSNDDVRTFEGGGASILNTQYGDLNADGRTDALIVLDPPVIGDAPADRRARTVQLLIRSPDGRLRAVARNDRIVPCETCAGLAGDPFGYARIDKDGFTLLTEGGSREHWSNEYTFKYAADRQDWLLDKVQRKVTDTGTGKSKKLALTGRDFGTVTFDDFDPETLPTVELP